MVQAIRIPRNLLLYINNPLRLKKWVPSPLFINWAQGLKSNNDSLAIKYSIGCTVRLTFSLYYRKSISSKSNSAREALRLLEISTFIGNVDETWQNVQAVQWSQFCLPFAACAPEAFRVNPEVFCRNLFGVKLFFVFQNPSFSSFYWLHCVKISNKSDDFWSGRYCPAQKMPNQQFSNFLGWIRKPSKMIDTTKKLHRKHFISLL